MAVFISYKSENADVANALCRHLEAGGIPCWIAPRNIVAGSYAGGITRAIRSCDLMIVILTKESVPSKHVKNEVSIAFNYKKTIVPYCLDGTELDDDLEYYLSSQQHIISIGRRLDDFHSIEKAVREVSRNIFPEQSEPSDATTPKKLSKALLFIPAGIVAVALVCILIFLKKDNTAPMIQDVIEAAVDSIPVPQTEIYDATDAEIETGTNVQPQTMSTPVNIPLSDKFSFTGKSKNGMPDGFGILTYKVSSRIDMHDEKGRIAESGDYIDGEWDNGHLLQGNWYDSAGTDKGFIIIGSVLDTETDKDIYL